MKHIIDRINTIEDAYVSLGIDPKDYILTIPSRGDLNKLVVKTNAQIQLSILGRCVNGDWKEDWNNKSQKKFVPYFGKTSNGWVLDDVADFLYYSNCSVWLYDSEYTARKVCEKFMYLYIEYITGEKQIIP